MFWDFLCCLLRPKNRLKQKGSYYYEDRTGRVVKRTHHNFSLAFKLGVVAAVEKGEIVARTDYWQGF